jgi:IclR family transcriptional regulator, blcABC operon repressor
MERRSVEWIVQFRKINVKSAQREEMMSGGDAGRRDAAALKNVPAVSRAHAVLDMVSACEPPLTVSEIARRLDLPKSTVHGLCATLVNLGLLSRRTDNGFNIGPHVMRWANAFNARSDVITEFAGLWDGLNVLSDETITLSVLEGPEVVYIACRNNTSPLGVTFRVGMRLPAPFTATGKAILSTWTDDRVRSLMANRWPEPLTANSVRHIDALLAELGETRARGFSIDNGQVRDGMWCFGIPVRDAANEIAAGVAVSILATRVDQPTIELIARNIRKVAEILSFRLGADVRALG